MEKKKYIINGRKADLKPCRKVVYAYTWHEAQEEGFKYMFYVISYTQYSKDLKCNITTKF